MTSFRQIEANRRNALKSTGPNTEEGKRRSRQNAVRHGLCAETVVEIIEDIDDYRGFEAAIIADYEARTAVERELVLRLASLLWRLRRATAIETDLMRIQAEILRDRGRGRVPEWSNDIVSVEERPSVHCGSGEHCRPQPVSSSRHVTLCFQRLANFDNGIFERLGRYESAIARQVLKTLYLLRPIRS
jgi:hypothetical protein